MAFIQIDINGMMTVINNLTERATAINAQRKNIRDSSTENHDPVPSVVDATIAYPAFLTPGPGSGTLSGCANGLLSLADELRTRRQEAIDLNSSGITTSDTSGVVSYYLPDPPEGTVDTEAYWNSMDTVANVKSYNSESVKNAQAESVELYEALSSGNKKSSKGRTPQEILDEIKKHQDIPTYGAAYISALGMDKYLELVELIGRHNTEHEAVNNPSTLMVNSKFNKTGADQQVAVLGHILASASQPDVVVHDNKGNPLDLANEIDSSVEEDGYGGRISAVNGLLETPGTVYGTTFLVDLAEKFEDNEYNGEETWHAARYPENKGSYAGSSMDPLYGVTMAMGNNPEAALAYLVPDGEIGADGHWTPGDKSSERWKRLAERTWDPNVGYDGFTAALGGASALRVRDTGTTDERAAWITGQGFSHLASQDVEYSSKSKQNISIMLANSLHEMEITAEGVPEGGTTEGGPQGAIVHPFDVQEPHPLSGDHSQNIKDLVRTIGTDDQALQILNNSIGRRSTQRTQATLDAHPRSTLGNDPSFDKSLEVGARKDGQLLGFVNDTAVNARIAKGEEEEAAQRDVASYALNGLATGLSFSPDPYSKIGSAAISFLSPEITESIVNRDHAAVDTAQEMSDNAQRIVTISKQAQLSNNNRIPDGAYSDLKGNHYSNVYSWMNADNTIDLRSVLDSPTAQQDFGEWADDEDIPDTLSNKFATGLQEGGKQAPK